MIHSLSLGYRGDSFYLGMGVRNLEEKSTTARRSSEVSGVKARAIGYGYDLMDVRFS